MSSDDGVYVAEFPLSTGSGVEYRVCYAQAIDNVDYGDEEQKDCYRFLYFGKVKSFSDKKEALLYAHEKADKVTEDGYPLEYGVSTLKFPRPLRTFTDEEVKKILG